MLQYVPDNGLMVSLPDDPLNGNFGFSITLVQNSTYSESLYPKIVS